MDDGLVERLQASQGVGPIRRGLAQVIEQPRMGGRNASGRGRGAAGRSTRGPAGGRRWRSARRVVGDRSLIRWARSRRRSRMFHLVPVHRADGLRQPRDDRLGPQGVEAIGGGHAVEQARQAEHGQRRGLPSAWARDSHAFIRFQHLPRGAVPLLPRQPVGLFQVANAIDAADVAVVGVEEEPAQQREAQRVAAELLAGVLQLPVGAGDLQPAQQADGDRPGQVVEVFPRAARPPRPSRSARAWRLLSTQRPGLDWASASGDRGGRGRAGGPPSGCRSDAGAAPGRRGSAASAAGGRGGRAAALAGLAEVFRLLAEERQGLLEEVADAAGADGFLVGVRPRALVVEAPVEVRQRRGLSVGVLPLLVDEAGLNPL